MQSFEPDLLDKILEVGLLLAFLVVGNAKQAEVVGHDEVPLLQFIQHLQLLYLLAFGFVYAIVVDVLHSVDLGVFEAIFGVPLVLVLDLGIFVDSHEGAAPLIEVFDHHLPESVVGVVHLVVEDKGQAEILVDEAHQVVYPVRINVAEDALRIEECRHLRVYFVVLYYLFELIQLRNVAGCYGILLPKGKEMLVL